MSKHLRRSFAGRNRGFTLVELMVAMVLGLVIIGGATGVIIANRQSYRTNEGLSQVQEGARTAFELMARDIRQAGVTGCDSKGRIANVLETESGSEWWQNWFAMRGYAGDAEDSAVAFGTDARQRLAGTDSLQLQGLDGPSVAVASHSAADASFVLNTSPPNLAAGDVMMVCDFNHSAIFAVSGYNDDTKTLDYSASNTGDARNASEGLGFPSDLSSDTGNAYGYPPSSQMSRVMAVDWYVGNNGRDGGRSLFRQRMGMDGPEEMVAGVSGLNLMYLETDGTEFEEVGDVGDWANVIAVQITLTIDSADQRVSTNPGDNQGRLQRSFTNVITLRNRVL